MYYYYNALANIFHENLVCKKGDTSECHGYHINLLYWCKPGRQKKIDGCDFIYSELKRSMLSCMTPRYCAYVQKLIDSMVETKFARTGECYKHNSLSLSLLVWVEVPGMQPTDDVSHGTPLASISRRAPPRKKRGAAKFFKNLWDMCRSTHDVVH
jgi:hypothetical protein